MREKSSGNIRSLRLDRWNPDTEIQNEKLKREHSGCGGQSAESIALLLSWHVTFCQSRVMCRLSFSVSQDSNDDVCLCFHMTQRSMCIIACCLNIIHSYCYYLDSESGDVKTQHRRVQMDYWKGTAGHIQTRPSRFIWNIHRRLLAN